MAPRDGRPTGWWETHGTPVVLLVVFFGLALFLRAFFNYGPSFDGGVFRWSGTDPYYHLHVMEHIVATGRFLLFDPLINYPIGAVNPRPPLFSWTTAAFGGLLAPLFGGDATYAVRYVAMFSPAVWAALTVVPAYLLARAAFNRAAGLWAALFVAIMPAHMMRSALGNVDHDAIVIFLFTFGAFAFLKALQLLKMRDYVADYRDGASIGPGYRSFFGANQAAIAYAALAGAFWGAVALTWKGYVYIFAILAVWFGIQLLANHLRRRDSTGYFVIGLAPVVVALVMMFPYYQATGRVESTVLPTVYILIGMLVASLVFVPTRHWPPILVIPVTLIAAAVGLIIMLLVFPHIGELFFTGLGYFVQTKLYSTIAEAQRTQIGFLAFSVGVVPFFFGIIALFMAAWSFIRRSRDDHLYLLVWGGVGVLMAFAATRFVYNSAVPFAVLAGWVTARLVSWVRYADVRKSWRTFRAAGTGWFRTTRSAVGLRQVAGTLFLVLILLVPSVWLGVDASVPHEYARQQSVDNPDSELWTTHLGAFGQSFLADDWVDALEYLNRQDPGVPPHERPAFIAWWDYGFYAVNKGRLPTVADPFQFGYQISGRFLASTTEAEAILYMSIRLLEGNSVRGDVRNAFDADVRAVLEDVRPGLADELRPLVHRGADYDRAYDLLAEEFTGTNETELDHQAVVAFYRDVREATGTSIRYAALDGRMFPCDDKRQGATGVESASIFYAPVFLADKNPEDFVETVYQDSAGAEYVQRVYETVPDERGDPSSRQFEQPYVEGPRGERYMLAGGTLLPITAAGHLDYDNPRVNDGIQLVSESLRYSERFYQTFLYRAWVGGQPADPSEGVPGPEAYAPGQDLKNFRLVYTTVRLPDEDGLNRCGGVHQETGITTGLARGVAVLKYYDGAPVSGVVRDDEGQAMAGVTVRVADNFGIFHDSTTTDAEGRYSLMAPFSTEDDPDERASEPLPLARRSTGPNVMQVVMNGEVAAEQEFSVSEDQAMGQGPALDPVDFTVRLGTLRGFVFHDAASDGSFDNETDRPLEGAEVRLGERTTTTDAEGRFSFTGVRPGGRSVQVTHDTYLDGSATTAVPSGGEATVDVAMRPAPTTVQGRLLFGGEPVADATVVFSSLEDRPDATDFSNATGEYSVLLADGLWEATVDHETIEDGVAVRYFTPEPVSISVRHGDPTQTLDIELQREVQE